VLSGPKGRHPARVHNPVAVSDNEMTPRLNKLVLFYAKSKTKHHEKLCQGKPRQLLQAQRRLFFLEKIEKSTKK
jgi:hypothetical protein